MSKVLSRSAIGPVCWLSGLVLLFLVPFAASATEINGLLEVLYLAVAVMSLNLLTGFNGQASIGHSAFLGLGAYTTAIAVQNYGWSYWTALPVAILVAGFVGAVAGLPALRIRGMNLALVTIALALVFPQIPVRFTDQTGGTAGLNVDKRFSTPPVLGVVDIVWQYWVLLGIAALVFLFIRNTMRSSIGRALIAIRDQQVAAYTVGINVKVIKVAVFAASSAIAGLAGWMFTVRNQFVSPGDFTVLVSINLLVGMAVGGAGMLVGPILGALFLHYVPVFMADSGVNPQLTPVVYGIVLILLMLVLRSGLAGGIQSLVTMLRRRFSKSDNTERPPHVGEELPPPADLLVQPQLTTSARDAP
jgi:branched-chain amino acid transport system permease protein